MPRTRRPSEIRPSAAVGVLEVVLSNGGVALIDEGDRVLVEGYRWRRTSGPGREYAGTCFRKGADGDGKAKVKHRTMHRLIMGFPLGRQTDHVNGDGLDNRRANLRLCTQSENACNRGGNVGSSSKYKGVSWAGKKWTAGIGFQGRWLYLGRFGDERDAARAYDEVAILFHGSFARTNAMLYPGEL